MAINPILLPTYFDCKSGANFVTTLFRGYWSPDFLLTVGRRSLLLETYSSLFSDYEKMRLGFCCMQLVAWPGGCDSWWLGCLLLYDMDDYKNWRENTCVSLVVGDEKDDDVRYTLLLEKRN